LSACAGLVDLLQVFVERLGLLVLAAPAGWLRSTAMLALPAGPLKLSVRWVASAWNSMRCVSWD
jgi:hypothetical protein